MLQKLLLISVLILTVLQGVESLGSCSPTLAATFPCNSCSCAQEISYAGYGWKTIENGFWGNWKAPQYQPDNKYLACGMQWKKDSDDTGANGFKVVFCQISNWSTKVTKTVWTGNWGSWGSVIMCPFNTFIEGGQIRLESKQGIFGDDSAANGFKMRCGATNWVLVSNGNSGSWKSQVTHSGQNVCGAKIKYEDPTSDNTAMNGMQYQFCNRKCGTGQCIGCAATYYLSGTSCIACVSPCASCSTSLNCTSCLSGFLLGAQRCKTCATWKSNCNTCSNFSTCTNCADGYYLSAGSCILCNNPCNNCSNSVDCLSCDIGYLLAGKLCTTCISPCSDCITTITTCTSCISTHILGIDECKTCSTWKANCNTCIDYLTCNTCIDGWYVAAGDCFVCVAPCEKCSGLSTTCTSCPVGKFLGNSTCKTCQIWLPNCATCTDFDTCAVCDLDYYVGPLGTCVQCDIGCASCLNNIECLVAEPGYTLINIPKVAFPCIFPCVNCLGTVNTCTLCETSDPARVLDTCECVDLFYDDGITGQCQACMDNCATCVNGTECITMKACDVQCSKCEVSESNCTTCSGQFREAAPSCVCLAGYFEANGQCVRCLPQCLTCTSILGCTACTNPDLAAVACLFKKSLTRGFFSTELEEGQLPTTAQCAIQCKACETKFDNCLSCQGNERNVAPECTCLDGKHDEDSTLMDCIACDSTCETCSSQQTCLTCSEMQDREINGFSQRCDCKVGYAEKIGTTTCMPCHNYEGSCYVECPPSTKTDSNAMLCIDLKPEVEDNVALLALCAIGVLATLAIAFLVLMKSATAKVRKAAPPAAKPDVSMVSMQEPESVVSESQDAQLDAQDDEGEVNVDALVDQIEA